MRRAKRSKLRRSSGWYAARVEPIPRKVAWRVLGFSSPRVYRQWRDQRIRTETSHRKRPRPILCRAEEFLFTRAWVIAQPREWRARIAGMMGHYLDDRPYVVQPGDNPWRVAHWMSGQDSPGAERELAHTNPVVSANEWLGWKPGVIVYLPSTWALWRGHDYWPTTREQVSEWIKGPGLEPYFTALLRAVSVRVYSTVLCLACGHPPCPFCAIYSPEGLERLETEKEWIGWCDRDLNSSLGSQECCEGICFYPRKPLFFTIDPEGKRRLLEPSSSWSSGAREKTSGSKPA